MNQLIHKDNTKEVKKLREEQLSNVRTAAAYVHGPAERSLTHRAVRHPYLSALENGTLPDTRWALADFARHYYGYASHFPRYLADVISRLVDPAHRRSVIENLTEEPGIYGEEEYSEPTRDWGYAENGLMAFPHPGPALCAEARLFFSRVFDRIVNKFEFSFVEL